MRKYSVFTSLHRRKEEKNDAKSNVVPRKELPQGNAVGTSGEEVLELVQPMICNGIVFRSISTKPLCVQIINTCKPRAYYYTLQCR